MSDAHSAFGFRLNDCCIGSVTGTPDRQRAGGQPSSKGMLGGLGGGDYKTNRQEQHPLKKKCFKFTKMKCFTSPFSHKFHLL